MQRSGALGHVHEWVKRSKIRRTWRLGRTWNNDPESFPVSFINSSWSDQLFLQREALTASSVVMLPLWVTIILWVVFTASHPPFSLTYSHKSVITTILMLKFLRCLPWKLSNSRFVICSTNILCNKGGRKKICIILAKHQSGVLVLLPLLANYHRFVGLKKTHKFALIVLEVKILKSSCS